MAKAGYPHVAQPPPTGRLPSFWANSGLAIYSKVCDICDMPLALGARVQWIGALWYQTLVCGCSIRSTTPRLRPFGGSRCMTCGWSTAACCVRRCFLTECRRMRVMTERRQVCIDGTEVIVVTCHFGPPIEVLFNRSVRRRRSGR